MKTPKQRAWDSFSKWVRARDAHLYGDGIYAPCVTCGNVYPTTRLQGGHWLPRNKTGTLLDASNVHAQCVGCNKYGRGMIAEHAAAIVRLHGDAELETLTRLSRKVVKVRDWGFWERFFDEALIMRRWHINPWRGFVEGA